MYIRNTDLETLGLPEVAELLDPPSAPSNYKDPQKIADYIRDATARQLEMLAVDPHCCRVVAFGWEDISRKDPIVALCSTEFEEREQLKQFWDGWRDLEHHAAVEQKDLAPYQRTEPVFLTFNGNRFDLPLLMLRSMYLNVKYPTLNLDRWRSPHIDLYQKLTLNGVVDGHSLRFFAKRLGLPIYDDISGKEVAAAIEAGEWQKVHDHCLNDLALNRAIAERIGAIPVIARSEVAA